MSITTIQMKSQSILLFKESTVDMSRQKIFQITTTQLRVIGKHLLLFMS